MSNAILAGVMGWPVAHSKSPLIHRHWFERYGVAGDYVRLAVQPQDLEQAFAGLRALGFCGVNVTVPHKQAVMALVDRCDDLATQVGAVNTVVFHPDGTTEGCNTDVIGFLHNLESGPVTYDKPVAVIGAGGAARAVVAGLIMRGCGDIRLANRTLEKAQKLRDDFGPAVQPIPWEARATMLADCGVLVNTTSLGMDGQPPLDLSLTALPQDAVVTDIVYAPLQTPLLKAAADRGNTTIDGLGMLLHQAAPAFAAWTGVEPVVDDELRRLIQGSI